MADNVKKEILLKINRYKRSENNLERALELCDNPDYINDVNIQHQKMEILCMLKRFEEAIAIGERPEFAKEMPIQLKLVEGYVGLKDYKRAMDICNRPEYINHQGFIQKSKRIRKDLLRINGAEVDITSIDFNDYIKTIDNLVKMAKQDKNPGRARKLLQKALGYCSNEAFKDNIEAALYRIKILKLLGEYQIALEIASDEKYLDNIDFFVQIISILKHLKKNEEALSLIEKSPFKNESVIKDQKQSILLKKDDNNKKSTKSVSLNDLLGYIESKRLSLEVIESLPINQMLKDILTIAYYEVRDEKSFIYQYLLEMDIRYENNDECLKLIEDVKKHFDNAQNAYDRMFYQRLLIISQGIGINNSRKG